MTESSVILAYLDGLGPRAAPQAVGNLRDDLKTFVTGDFRTVLMTLCMYDGDGGEEWTRYLGDKNS